ncbi:MAG: hypothetical protein HRT68_10155 [Flavobacteriaceae bacterium]|nr:hypothetical protein [Flavobacteriaceae bacterium]
MKKLILVGLLLVGFACKNTDKAEIETEATTQNDTKTEEIVEKKYPQLPEFTNEVTFIHYDEHSFSDDITCGEIGLFKTQTGYNFLVYFTKSTNLDELSNYNLIFMIYPEDKSKLESEKDRQRGFELISAKCYVMMDGKTPVVLIPDVNLNYKKIEKIRSYLHNKNGILNPEKPKLSTEPFEL